MCDAILEVHWVRRTKYIAEQLAVQKVHSKKRRIRNEKFAYHKRSIMDHMMVSNNNSNQLMIGNVRKKSLPLK